MSTETPRNPDGYTENELWAQLDGQVGAERSSTLVDLVMLIINRDEYEQALPLADAAVDAANESDNDQQQALASTTRGYVYYGLKRYAESAADHLRAARLYERYESHEPTYRAYFNASWSAELDDQYEQALECADAAIATAVQLDDPEAVGRSHRQRVDVLLRLERSDEEVLEALSAARQQFRKAGAVDRVLEADERAARVFRERGDYSEAINLLKDCLAVAETLGEQEAARCSYQLGISQRFAELANDAKASFQRPYEYNLKNQDTGNLAHVLFELAYCEWLLDNDDEAFRLMTAARANADAVGNDELVYDCDMARARWYHNKSRYSQAAQINELLMETRDGFDKFAARARLADNYRNMAMYDKALELTEPIPEEAEFYGSSFWIWRECIRAITLESMERQGDAWAIAEHCMAMDMSEASAFAQAVFHEMLGDKAASLQENDKAAQDSWARSVAFYLEAGCVNDARRLSRKFLPDTAAAAVQ